MTTTTTGSGVAPVARMTVDSPISYTGWARDDGSKSRNAGAGEASKTVQSAIDILDHIGGHHSDDATYDHVDKVTNGASRAVAIDII